MYLFIWYLSYYKKKSKIITSWLILYVWGTFYVELSKNNDLRFVICIYKDLFFQGKFVNLLTP